MVLQIKDYTHDKLYGSYWICTTVLYVDVSTFGFGLMLQLNDVSNIIYTRIVLYWISVTVLQKDSIVDMTLRSYGATLVQC